MGSGYRRARQQKKKRIGFGSHVVMRLNAQERWNGKEAATKRVANEKGCERKGSALMQPKKVVPQPSTVWGCSSAGAATPLGAGVISASSVVEHLLN